MKKPIFTAIFVNLNFLRNSDGAIWDWDALVVTSDQEKRVISLSGRALWKYDPELALGGDPLIRYGYHQPDKTQTPSWDTPILPSQTDGMQKAMPKLG